MLYFFRVCFDYLFAEFQTSVCIDGIPNSSIKAVIHVAAFISDFHLHVDENILAYTKLHKCFVLIKMWFGIARLVSVTKKGIKQYESFILDLLHILHTSPFHMRAAV